MNDSFFTPIDIYCERLDPSFWAEPWNAVSNASFLLAAWFSWRLARDKGCMAAIEVKLLIALIATVGVGSFLFHTFAVRWAMLADVIPIFAYQSFFLIFYLRKVARLDPIRTALWFTGFLMVSVGFGELPEAWLNGSLSYASALLFIAGMGIYHWRSRKEEPLALLAASGIFSVSLFFRSIDMAVCDRLAVGTHSIWHLLNGAVLYLTARGFVANAASEHAETRAARYV